MKNKRRLYTGIALATCLFMLLPVTDVRAEDGTNDGTIEINEDNFPNEIFRQYVSDTFDLEDENGVKDGKLSAEEIAKATKIDLKNNYIDDLRGIEYFTGLKELICENNQLTNLDISKNTELVLLDLTGNKLTNLDVSKNINLHTLNLDDNQLTSLDVSKNTNLLNLNISGNKLTSLDVSKNVKLGSLNLPNNQLTDLDVSKNTDLGYLSLSNNQLTNLDISKNTRLSMLFLSNNQLTDLDVSKNTKLEYLWCENNQFSSLDLTKNEKLTSLKISPQAISLYAIKDGDSYYIELPSDVNNANIESVTGGDAISKGIALDAKPQVGDVISYAYKTDDVTNLMNVNITILGVRDITETIKDEETTENITETITETTTEKETPKDTVEEPTSVVTTDTGNSVQTGDMNMPFIYILSGMAGISGVILTMVIRKKDLLVKK
ncbi:MAG: hypothetical protein K2M73_04970 [Lachnospiraceae bacterium]|nr:hypothetical protein [Lachnospiraceae bacterium]